MNSQKPNTPPFIDEADELRKTQSQRETVNYFVMFIGWLGLTYAMVGGAKVIYDYFFSTEKLQGFYMLAQMITLGLTFLVGWVVSLISIRKLHNLILPMLIKFYTFCVLAGILIIYGRGMFKTFTENDMTLFKYFLVLIVGYLLLIGLHLLLTEQNLIPHTFILLIAAFVHLLFSVSHYVFLEPKKPVYVFLDLSLFLTVVAIAFLLQQKWLYAPFRRSITRMFRDRKS